MMGDAEAGCATLPVRGDKGREKLDWRTSDATTHEQPETKRNTK